MSDELIEAPEPERAVIVGWRKWGLVVLVIFFATALCFFNTPGPESHPMLTGSEWTWFVIRVVFLYLAGNVSSAAFDKFFSKNT